MKERPILFSAPMVRALLSGNKTQTRRICKNQPYANGHGWDGNDIMCHNDYLPPSAMLMDCGGKSLYATSNMEGWESECPYGQPGDRLWVRESFGFNPDHPGQLAHVCYMADPEHKHDGIKWKPSIHMPRGVCRILLEIVSLRVEQLNDINEADARAEGIRRVGPGWERWHPDPADTEHTGSTQNPRLSYRGLWESINGIGSWAANPWVWVVEFKRVLP